ncbi:hypothetical protein AAZX31_18G276500 [Glycine max]|nr:unknown [Glycine max]
MNPTQHNPNVSLQQHSNPTLDTISLMKQGFLMMEEDFERGPRYHAYAALRETKLRMKYTRQQEYEQEEEKEGVVEAKVLTLTPPRKKQVKFQDGGTGVVSGRKGSSYSSSSSLVAQSVPDFSAVLRKENRKPVNGNVLPPLMELTPPSSKGVLSSARGSKSANAGEKRRAVGGGVLMPRKSYASIDELKSLPNAINGENRGGRSSRVITRKTVLGYRHI